MDSSADLGASDSFDRGLFSLAELYHENTKLRRGPDGGLVGAHELPPGAVLRYALQHSSKSYRSAGNVPLPRELPPLTATLEQVIRARSSVRDYSGAAMSTATLSRLLGLSYGVTGEALLDDGATRRSRRAAPSAGALYPVELYLAALRVEGLAPGLYHYRPRGHALECLRAGAVAAEVGRAVLYPEIVAHASVVVLLAAIFPRTLYKYGERGYRFALLDAGHVAQNIYLVATAVGLGAVAMGGFLDDELDGLLGLNGVDEATVYSVALGHPGGPPGDSPGGAE